MIYIYIYRYINIKKINKYCELNVQYKQDKIKANKRKELQLYYKFLSMQDTCPEDAPDCSLLVGQVQMKLQEQSGSALTRLT